MLGTNLHRCRCGSPAGQHSLCVDGVDLPIPQCDACWAETVEGYHKITAEFDELVATGVHPRLASRIIIVRHKL